MEVVFSFSVARVFSGMARARQLPSALVTEEKEGVVSCEILVAVVGR